MRHRSGRSLHPPTQPLEEHLFRCWFNGSGIGQTIESIRYIYGLTLPFETVRAAFIRCCDRFYGGDNA